VIYKRKDRHANNKLLTSIGRKPFLRFYYASTISNWKYNSFRSIKVWNVDALKQHASHDDTGGNDDTFQCNTLSLSPSGDNMAVSFGWARFCEVRNIATGKSIEVGSHFGYIKSANFTPDGTRVVVLDHGHQGRYEVNVSRSVSAR